MRLRLRVVLSAALLAIAALLGAASAAAEPGDADAKRLIKQAMEDDYAETKFDTAERKLKKAHAACVDKGCKPKLHAKVWGYLGIVYANGIKDQASAIVAFQEMLKLDPDANPDRNFSSDESDAAFQGAKSAADVEAKQANAEKDKAAAAARKKEEAARKKEEAEEERHRKAEEEAARAAEESEERRKAEEERRKAEEEEKKRLAEEAKKSEAEKKQAEQQQKCEVERVAEMDETPWVEQAVGYPIPIYVELGELKLPEGASVKKVVVEWSAPGVGEKKTTELAALGEGYGAYLPCAASAKEGEITYTVTAYNQCDNAVAMVGAEEPRTLLIKAALDNKQPHLPNELPPEMCKDGGPGDAMTCDADDDCPGGAKCSGGVCKAQGKTIVDPNRVTPRLNRLALLISPDFAIINGSEVCSRESRAEGQFTCFEENGIEYNGDPLKSSSGSITNVGPGTLRLSLGYERVLGKQLAIGARTGVTLLGPDRDDGKGVLPFHFEAHGAYYFSRDPFAHRSLRPYAHLALGLAEAAGRSGGVKLRDAQGQREFVVWQKGGPLVVGAGAGVELPISAAGGIVVEAAVRESLPTALTTIALSVGYQHGL